MHQKCVYEAFKHNYLWGIYCNRQYVYIVYILNQSFLLPAYIEFPHFEIGFAHGLISHVSRIWKPRPHVDPFILCCVCFIAIHHSPIGKSVGVTWHVMYRALACTDSFA